MQEGFKGAEEIDKQKAESLSRPNQRRVRLGLLSRTAAKAASAAKFEGRGGENEMGDGHSLVDCLPTALTDKPYYS